MNLNPLEAIMLESQKETTKKLDDTLEILKEINEFLKNINERLSK